MGSSEMNRPARTAGSVIFYAGLLSAIYIIFLCKFAVTGPYGCFDITYYDEQADAFLAGQTNLLRSPPPEMLALPDPWDPAANKPYREAPRQLHGQRYQGLHDLALYHGKLYLQWGPLPAVVIIPLRWLAGHDLPMGDVGLVVQTLAALAYALATLKLTRLAALPQSRSTTVMVVLLFLLCPVWTYNTRWIAIYETTIYFAQLCTSLALLCVVSAFERLPSRGKSVPWLFGLGSLFLGLSLNCRLDLALLGLLVPVVLYLWIRAEPQPPTWRRLISPALVVGGPAAFLLACALVYNKVRFGGFLDIGQDWQLWGGHESVWQHKFHYMSFARIVPNIIYYFFLPVVQYPGHEFIFMPPDLPPENWMSPDVLASYGDYYERASGLFVISPLTVLALLFPLLFLGKAVNSSRARARWIVLLLLICGFLSGFLLFLAPVVTRYCAEWCMWWLMASVVVAFQIRAALRARGARAAAILFDIALIVSTAWSSWIGICFLLIDHL